MSEAAVSDRLPPPRTLILIGLWGLFVVWMAIGTIANGITAVTGPAPGEFAHYRNGYAAILFALDFWGLGAAAIFGLVLFNPFAWLNGKRLIFGCFAFAIMLGRLTGGFATDGLMYTPLQPAVIIIAMPVVLLIGGIGVILILSVLIGLAFSFFVGIPVMLFMQIFEFEKSVQVFRYQSRGLAGYIVRAVFWLRNERLPASPPDDSKGARFATFPEITKLHNAAPEAMSFGHLGQPLFLKTDKHVLIMASTRSGKGVTLIIPHLLRYKGSAFVLDPKGENARATGRQRAKLNGKVHYLDPFGISGKPQSRFNPYSRFTPQNMEAESKALAAALFVIEGRVRDHWTAAGQQLLATLILYVYASPDIAKENKDLPQVRRLLLGYLKPALEDMVNLDTARLNDLGVGEAEELLRDLAMSFIATPEKEFGSIVSTAQRQTEILDNPYIAACLAGKGDAPEVDFRNWHKGTMSVFLCLSAPKFPTFNRWLRLVLTSALDEMTDTLNPPKLPVCFMLDELATLGHLPTVENAVGLAAGYGIQLVNIFQDVAQMRDLYKGRWASFIGNAGVRAVFNLDDYDTAEYWSKFVGGRIVETRGRQEDIYGYSQGENVGESMRPLLPSDKLMHDFAAGKMLVLAQGAHPVITDRIPYWNDASLKGLWDDPRAPIAPKPASSPGRSTNGGRPSYPEPPRASPATAANRPSATFAERDPVTIYVVPQPGEVQTGGLAAPAGSAPRNVDLGSVQSSPAAPVGTGTGSFKINPEAVERIRATYAAYEKTNSSKPGSPPFEPGAESP